MTRSKRRESPRIHLDEICEKLGKGFFRETVLKLGFHFYKHDPDEKTGLSHFVTSTDIGQLIKSPEELSNKAPYIFCLRDKVDEYIEKNAHYIRKINESHIFPFNYDQNRFHEHPFFDVNFHHAIIAWIDIYSTPSRDVSACGTNRKMHNSKITEYSEAFLQNLPATTCKNIKLLINPIPEKPILGSHFEKLSEDQFINTPLNNETNTPLPLTINHDIAKKWAFYPPELHMAIEAWIHIYGYARPNYKPNSVGCSHKQEITRWLAKNFSSTRYPTFTAKAFDRIAVFINPDKRNRI
jgi:hypothetical protein